MEILLMAAAALLAGVVILQLLLLKRLPKESLAGLGQRFESVEKAHERTERSVRDEFARNREETGKALHGFSEATLSRMTEIATLQKGQLETFSERLDRLTGKNEERMERLRETVQNQMKELREDNSKKLDQMRATVDEKLHETLEKRLGESFKLVSERLEQVYKGLGEMQTLASGVGDLKKVLTNVKTRGTWGEVQLGAMLEQVLTKEQYATNVATKDSGERVEFAVKMPGRSGDPNDAVWLPIDAKFPIEDYQRLVEAQEKADADAAEQAAKQIDARLKGCADDIASKYLNPPKTTDFGILFLPTEGLFAEVLRRPGLTDALQRDHRVIVAGPTTLWSLLNSLQMGFRTLAIEKRSSEVWALLGAVKTEFANFGGILDKTRKKLQEASNTIESAAVRSRAIERKLRDVQALPAGGSMELDEDGIESAAPSDPE